MRSVPFSGASFGGAASSHLFPPGDGSASSQLSRHTGHVRTVSQQAKTSKEAAACVPRSFGVFCVGFDTPGTAGFLKAAVHNQHPRVGTGAARLCLFYFVAHHYLTERERLELRSTCIDERPLRFPRTQSAVRPAQHKHQIYTANFFSLSSIPFPPLQLFSISHIPPFRNTSY